MRLISIISILLWLVSACAGNKRAPEAEYAGGTFRMAMDAGIATGKPCMVTDYYTSVILSQTMEGLVSLNPENLKVKPQLATSYKVSTDGLTYEFVLREDVLFHPHPAFTSEEDRKMTPEDILYSFQAACTKDDKGLPSPAYTSIFRKTVKGATAYFEGKAKTISGIRAKGNKLVIELIEKDANFLHKLADINAAITSRKVSQANGEQAIIGTGPFLFADITQEKQKTILLEKNPDYYMQDANGCALPYLDQLEFIIENGKQNQLALFQQGKTDFILDIPASGITHMLEGRIRDFNSVPPLLVLRSNPLLVTNYYFFNMQDPRFKDIRVRKAFNYAVDRARITRDILLGQVHENGFYGVVPPIPATFANYDFEGIRREGYGFDPEKARELLAQAGYPDGKDFGSVTLKFNIGDLQSAVAEEFARQISAVLNINVNIDGSSFEQKIKDADYLKGDIFRTAWYGDYCSPETFLQSFYGKLVPSSMQEPSPMNQSRYSNPAFDALFEKARHEKKVSRQLQYFNAAEKELLKDPPMIVLWYACDNQLIYSKVRNLQENPMNYLSFKEVYIKPWTREEYQDRRRK